MRQLHAPGRLLTQLLSEVIDPADAGAQPRLMAVQSHFQAPQRTWLVGIHRRQQGVGNVAFGTAEQADQPAVTVMLQQQTYGGGDQCGRNQAQRAGQMDACANDGTAQRGRRHGKQLATPIDRHATAAVQARIEGSGTLDFFGGGPDPHRLEADHLIPLADGRDEGIHPVVVPIPGAVLHYAHPAAALFQIAPEVGKYRRGDVRMADQVMRLAQQLLPGEAGYLGKGVVGVADHPAQIGRGDETVVVTTSYLFLCNGRMLAHGLAELGWYLNYADSYRLRVILLYPHSGLFSQEVTDVIARFVADGQPAAGR